MELVNTVYRGNMKRKIDLEKLHVDNIHIADFHRSRPRQLKLKFGNIIVLLFETGRFRVMGKCDEVEALLILFSIFDNPTDEKYIPQSLQLQTMTFTGNLGKINLNQLTKLIPCTYEYELFAGVRATKYNPMCVNIFASGAVVMTGCKDSEKPNEIFSELCIFAKQCTV